MTSDEAAPDRLAVSYGSEGPRRPAERKYNGLIVHSVTTEGQMRRDFERNTVDCCSSHAWTEHQATLGIGQITRMTEMAL